MVAGNTARVRQAALDCGFAGVGIAAADPVDLTLFHEWLALGYAGTMHYLGRNAGKRADVGEILHGARTVVVVAENYYTPLSHASQAGKISRYAWGDDYHDVAGAKLRELASKIEAIVPGSISKSYVDTGATLDKVWAVRAGLGWQGKHTNIISRAIGSWFFIGLIISTAELLPDAPVEDFCGDCTACIDACPTGAIVQPYLVDGTLCLSYWTIETKPDIEIPLDIAQNMDGWAFGCDICQDVCPWNRFRKITGEQRYLPRNGETTLNPAVVAEMTQDEFSSRFRQSPVKRTKLAGLQRNMRAAENYGNEL